MKLCAIILNYRTALLTERAIDAALVALEPIGDAALVVVDNDSRDGSFERLAAYAAEPSRAGRVRVVQTGHNGGFGYGNNFAIREALASADPPEYVYILNSDAFPAPDAIEALVTVLDRDRGIGIAGSYIHGVDGEPHETAFRFPTIAGELEDAMKLGVVSRLLASSRVPLAMPEVTGDVDWLAGASMMIRASVLDAVGLFDETFFLYFEETDLCRRVRLSGARVVYVRESRVAHVGSASTGMKTSMRRMPTYWLDSRAHYFAKNHGPLYLAGANAARLVGGASFRVRSVLQRKENPDPPHLLRDLLRHALERALRQ